MPRFSLTLLFVIYLYLLVMTPGLPAGHVHPQFSLAWSGSSLTWSLSWLPPHRLTWCLTKLLVKDLFALYIGPVLYQYRVLGCLGHDTLVCFSGDCISWCQLWLQSPALGFSMSTCPGFICSLPRQEVVQKAPKNSRTKHGTCWKLLFFLLFPNKFFILRRAETKKLV